MGNWFRACDNSYHLKISRSLERLLAIRIREIHHGLYRVVEPVLVFEVVFEVVAFAGMVYFAGFYG